MCTTCMLRVAYFALVLEQLTNVRYMWLAEAMMRLGLLWMLILGLVAHENPQLIKEGCQTLGCCLLYLIVGGTLVSFLPGRGTPF